MFTKYKACEKNMSLSSENAKKFDAGGGFLFLFFLIFVYPNPMLGTFG